MGREASLVKLNPRSSGEASGRDAITAKLERGNAHNDNPKSYSGKWLVFEAVTQETSNRQMLNPIPKIS
jgi:hypothetical protein